MLQTVPFPYPRLLADQWIADSVSQRQDGAAYHFAITGQRDRGQRCWWARSASS